MGAYFVRRSLSAVVTWLLATCVLYSLMMYWPGGVVYDVDGCGRGCRILSYFQWSELYFSKSPWPENYLRWLFNVGESPMQYAPNGYVPYQTSVELGGLRLNGTGILTGAWGYSTSGISDGTPVLTLLGGEPGALLVSSLALVFLLMLIATLQRRGRASPLATSHGNARSNTVDADFYLAGYQLGIPVRVPVGSVGTQL